MVAVGSGRRPNPGGVEVAEVNDSKKMATRLHSQYVRERDRVCVVCRREFPMAELDAMHVVPRRFSLTRTDVSNGWAGCRLCHNRLTDHPGEHGEFFARFLGAGEVDRLWAKARGPLPLSMPVFWREEADRLRALLEVLRASRV